MTTSEDILVVLSKKVTQHCVTPQKARAYIRSYGLSVTKDFTRNDKTHVWQYKGKKKPELQEKASAVTKSPRGPKKPKGKKDYTEVINQLMPMWGTYVNEAERELHRALKPVEMRDLINDFGDWPKGVANDKEMRRRSRLAGRIAKWYCTK